MKICIVGLGYLGLPPSLQFARCGRVLGLEVDSKRVASTNRGESYTRHIAKEVISEQSRAGSLLRLESRSESQKSIARSSEFLPNWAGGRL